MGKRKNLETSPPSPRSAREALFDDRGKKMEETKIQKDIVYLFKYFVNVFWIQKSPLGGLRCFFGCFFVLSSGTPS
jgi:hypothetical protein